MNYQPFFWTCGVFSNNVDIPIGYLTAESTLIFPLVICYMICFGCNKLVYMVIKFWKSNGNELNKLFDNGVHTYNPQ